MAEISTPHFSLPDNKLIENLYNALPDAVIGLELSAGRILYWNNAATAMFGLPAEDAIGKTLELIFADRESFQSFAADLVSAIRKQGSWRAKQEVYRRAGARIYTDITAALVRPHESLGEFIVLVFHECASPQDADTDLETYTRYQEIIADLGQRALGDEEIDSLMDGAVKGVAGAFGADYSSVLELLPGGNELLLRAGAGWEPGRVGEKIGAGSASQERYTLASEKPVAVEDIQRETRFSGVALLRDREVESGISVIIRGRSRPYGILSAHTVRQRTFTRDDIHFFLSIADLLSNAIERNRIERELQSLNGRLLEVVKERTKLLQLLQEIAIIANEASSIDNALETTIDKICKETSFPCPETALLIGHVYRLITTDATPRVDYWHLSNPEMLAPFRAASEASHFDYGVGLIGRVLTSRKLEWTADLTHDGNDPRAQVAGKLGLKTAIAFPILAGHDVAAVMELFTSETLTPDAPLLETLSQVGIALGRIVERKLTEERLRQNQLLATIGSTAAKLAHNISNPLNGMYTSTQLLERACKDVTGSDNDIIPSMVKGLKLEVDRLRLLLHEFRTLSELTKFTFELADVSEIASEVTNLERSHCARQAVTIKLDFPAGLPKVTLDREKIKQALLNLCENAVDAMPTGGTVTIRGYRFWEVICVEVHDTGPGVPERTNVFEIFTTTKRGGTGLGLPIVQQIIAGHRGSVTFASESGKGTVFRLTLPINPKS